MSELGSSSSVRSGGSSSPQRSRSAKIRQIVSSQDSFDRYIAYPLGKDGTQSPDVGTGSKDFVSPDELFGPVSPSRVNGHDGSVDDNVKKHRTRKHRGDAHTEEAYSNTRRDNHRSREHNKPSTFSDTEEPLRSYSRFESVARKDANSTDSRTHTNKDNNNRASRADTSNSDMGSNLKASSVNVTRDNVNKVRSRLYQNNGLLVGSSYNHTHVFDDRLNISDSKLDATLLRLFSRNSTSKENYASFDRQAKAQLTHSHSDFIGLEPVMWRVHPMTATHKETLDRELDFIAFHVRPRDIINRLYRDGVLTSLDYNQLSRTEGQGDKAVTRLMIRTLQRRGCKAYPALLDALLASDYFFVCERLAQSEHGLYNGMVTDRAESRWKRGDILATPFKMSVPYQGLSPAYANETSTYPFENEFSSNQNESWPLTNRMSVIDHMTPIYNSPSAKNSLATEDVLVHDFRAVGSSRLEQRIDGLETGLRLIGQEISSLKTGTRPSTPNNEPPRHHRARKRSPPETNEDAVFGSSSLDHQLADIKSRLTELRDHVTGLMAARSGASRMDDHPFRFRRESKSDSSNQKSRSERQATPPRHRINSHKNVKDQMREFQRQLKELRRDIKTLTASTSESTYIQMKNSVHGSYLEMKELTDDHERHLGQKLDGHLGALRAEIKMLHDDVTALKMARSLSSTPRKSPPPQRMHRDQDDYPDNHYSHNRQHNHQQAGREKSDISYFNATSEPAPRPSFVRYPSRYSPRDPDNGQPRSDRIPKGREDKQKSTSNRADFRNHDNRNNKNRTKSTKDDFNEHDDWSLSKDDETAFHEKGSSQTLQDNHGSSSSIGAHNKENRWEDSRSFSKSSNDKPLDKTQPPPVPIIITPDEKFSKAPASSSRTKNTLSAPEETPQPREKKKVRYDTKTPESDTARSQRIHQQRPMTRAANPAHRSVNNTREAKPAPAITAEARRNAATPSLKTSLSLKDKIKQHNHAIPKGSREGPRGNSSRPPSATDSISSDDSQYVRLTTPTRILSPPNGTNFERVTTPYKILRNPSNRRITTWSKSSKKIT